jgi:hypothetical protein
MMGARKKKMGRRSKWNIVHGIHGRVILSIYPSAAS